MASQMMYILRIILMFLTLAMIATMGYFFFTATWRLDASQWTLVLSVWIGGALNLIYLWNSGARSERPRWRLFRLGALWLDAKEAELKARSKADT